MGQLFYFHFFRHDTYEFPYLFYRKKEYENMIEETSKTTHPKPSLFGLITSPVEQFKRMKQRPVIWGPSVIVLILFT